MAQVPPRHGDAAVAEPGEHPGRLGDRRAGHPAEADVHERGAGPLGHQAGRLAGLGVGVGVRRAAGHHQQRQPGPARGHDRLAQQLDRRPGHPERPTETGNPRRVAFPGLDHHGRHVALGVAGAEQHQRQHHDPPAPAGRPADRLPRRPAGRSSPGSRPRPPPREGRPTRSPGPASRRRCERTREPWPTSNRPSAGSAGPGGARTG